MARVKSSKTQLEEKVAKLQAVIETLQSQVDDFNQKIGDQDLALQQKDTEIQGLKYRNTTALGDVERLQKELEKAGNLKQDNLRDKDLEIKRLTEDGSEVQRKARREIEVLQQKLDEARREQETKDKATQDDKLRTYKEAEDRLKALQTQLDGVNSTKHSVEGKLIESEARLRQQDETQQEKIAELERKLEDANTRVKEADQRFNQEQHLVEERNIEIEQLKGDHQELIIQKDLEIEKLTNDHVQLQRARHASTVSPQRQDSQLQDSVETQASTPQAKKVRRAVNRSVQVGSTTASSEAQTSSSEHNYAMSQRSASRVGATDISQQFDKNYISAYNASGMEETQQDDDDMLDTENLHQQFSKTNTPPATSQSESQKAFSLGSQEILDQDGVRFKGLAGRTQTQTQSQEMPSPSSSLSGVLELDDSYKTAAEIETQASQSQLNDPDLHIQDALTTPRKNANNRNLQGVGRKLTPRPERQATPVAQKTTESSKAQEKPRALPTIPCSQVRSATNAIPKTVSALSSGPHNFKKGSVSKPKSVRYEDDGNDYDSSSDPISAPSNQLSLKRPAVQSSKSSKRPRTETTSPAQRSVSATPRRSQSNAKSSAGSKGSPLTPGVQRRRSTRTGK